MKRKIVSAEAAAELVRDGDCVTTSGFVGIGVPEELLLALEQRFIDTGAPRDLTLFFAAGQGDGKDRGLNRLGHEGLLKLVIGGHWGLIPKVAKLALDNKVEGYNLPQGVISPALPRYRRRVGRDCYRRSGLGHSQIPGGRVAGSEISPQKRSWN